MSRREDVVRSLGRGQGFRTAQQLFAQMRSSGSRIGLATIYRTVQSMADEGEVDVLRTDAGEVAYRRCQSPEHHHHLVCRECGATVEIAARYVEQWAGQGRGRPRLRRGPARARGVRPLPGLPGQGSRRVTATPVIALHGQPGAGWVYAAVAARLADLGTHVLAPDRPGYGANAAPATGIAGNARWLREQITDRPAARAVVVAHSWAALPAIVAAAHSPDLVAALILLSPAGPSAVTPTDRLIARRGVGGATTWPLAVPASGRMSWLARPWLQIAVPRADRDRARKALRDSPTRGVMTSFLVEQRAMLHEMNLVRAALAELAVPCTVVIGTADALIAPRSMIELARSLPGCDVELLNGSGHSVQLHRPAEVAAIIQRVARS